MRYKRLSAKKVDLVLRCFCEDLTATASISGVNRNTVNSYFREICERIFQQSLKENPLETGKFELDESYFSVRSVFAASEDVVRRGTLSSCSPFNR
ncbi:MAG: hypothetical protein LBQ54_10450 [Planctomycetaceae bacterium]|jgi:hypothetical protein|nr:hypothetical protein [Planctomycetaceae bacterium]